MDKKTLDSETKYFPLAATLYYILFLYFVRGALFRCCKPEVRIYSMPKHRHSDAGFDKTLECSNNPPQRSLCTELHVSHVRSGTGTAFLCKILNQQPRRSASGHSAQRFALCVL